jgi:hypothetical protein
MSDGRRMSTNRQLRAAAEAPHTIPNGYRCAAGIRLAMPDGAPIR